MKKLILLIVIAGFSFLQSRGQCFDNWLEISFDSAYCMERVFIDTVSNTNNIWQIGLADKAVFDSAICFTKVIVTDTSQPYPINDTSAFIIKSAVTPGMYYGGRHLYGDYYVQSDSLKDYGKIEFSHDNGLTWVDMLNDTNYANNFKWWTKPVLSGNSKSCKSFIGDFWDMGSTFNLQIGDTILFRISFISDSIFDNLGGLMFDNLIFSDYVEGMSEIRFKTIKSNIFPNPGSDIFTIDFENPLSNTFELSIYDIRSKLMLKKEGITEKKIVIDTRSFMPDTYVYKITDWKNQKRGWGKFVIIR